MSVKKLFENLDMTDKQISIMSAAIEIFAEKGYEATRTSEIAKKAGVGEGTIFHHYKTKKDLLLAIPEYLLLFSASKIYMEDINKIFESQYTNLEEFLKAIIQNRRDFVTANDKLVKVLFQEMPFQPELRTKLSELLLPTLNKFVSNIDKFKEQGQIIDLPSTVIVKLIFTSLFGYFFTRHIAKLEFQWDEKAELDSLIKYIMHGISTADK